jgi:uncharacterized protein (DUF4415 family)
MTKTIICPICKKKDEALSAFFQLGVLQNKKWRHIMSIVRYSSGNVPKPTRKDWDRLDRVKDKDIDTSDIPEITDFSKFRPWEDRRMYKPIKVTVTCKLDADIVAWLKREGKGYQTRLNAILRQVMSHAQ